MKIYISSYMTGYPDLNAPAFNAKQKELESKGFEVLSPVSISKKYGTGRSYDFYLKKAMCLLLKADVVLVFGDKRGLSLSQGVKKELSLAALVNTPVFENTLPDWVTDK